MKVKFAVILISLALLFGFSSVSLAGENEERVVIHVEGLYCPFCSYGLEKHIKKIKGFKSIKINIREGTAEINFESGAKVSKAAILEAVENAGFELDGVTWLGKEPAK